MAATGFKTQAVETHGLTFRLTEISAQQRVDFLQRIAGYKSETGFELIRNDLAISADLIALHMQHPLKPRWVVQRQVRNLSARVIADLFNACVELSNLPFRVSQKAGEDAEPEQEQPTEGD